MGSDRDQYRISHTSRRSKVPIYEPQVFIWWRKWKQHWRCAHDACWRNVPDRSGSKSKAWWTGRGSRTSIVYIGKGKRSELCFVSEYWPGIDQRDHVSPQGRVMGRRIQVL